VNNPEVKKKFPWALYLSTVIILLAAGLIFKNPEFSNKAGYTEKITDSSWETHPQRVVVSYPDFDFKSAFIAAISTIICFKIYELVRNKLDV